MSSPELIMEVGRQMADNSGMAPAGDAPAPRSTTPDAALALLLERSRGGDATAMEAIYLRFKGAFFNLAYRYGGDRAAAEDLLQEIFIKIFIHIGDVRSPEMFPGWAYRIALNSCYSYLREKKSKTRQTVSLTNVGETIGFEGPDQAESDLRKPLQDAIAGLPRRLKEIFLLHDVQGFKHAEIASMLRLSVGTSKSQLFKARHKVRDYLKARRIGLGE
ncbi:MAG: RNA polymerase sigma factor [Candidatus Aminicenantales bacterium]